MAYYGARSKNDLYLKAGIDGFSVWEWNALMAPYRYELSMTPDGRTLDFWGNYPQHNLA